MRKVHRPKRRRHYTICVAATSDDIYTLSSQLYLANRTMLQPSEWRPRSRGVYGVYPCLWPFLQCHHNLFRIFVFVRCRDARDRIRSHVDYAFSYLQILYQFELAKLLLKFDESHNPRQHSISVFNAGESFSFALLNSKIAANSARGLVVSFQLRRVSLHLRRSARDSSQCSPGKA